MSAKVFKNWKVTAWLSTPLNGEPPALDGIFEWELALRLGKKHAMKAGRWTPVEEFERLPVPLAVRTFNGRDVFCCSNPIICASAEWTDRTSKRFESSKMALLIDPKHRKSVMTASGPYKSRFTPERVRLVERVCWFTRGEKMGMNKLLKSVLALGRKRDIGYGFVWKWEFEEVNDDYSVFAWHKGKKVLMKTIPLCRELDNVCGYTHGYAGYRPPFWHPAFMCDVAIPC